MQLRTRFKNVENLKNMNEFVKTEANKLIKFFDGRFSVELSTTKTDLGHVSVVKVVGPQFTYHSKCKDQSVHKSVMMAFEKISKQLGKTKEKRRNKIRRSNLKNPKHSQIFQLIRNEEKVIEDLEIAA